MIQLDFCYKIDMVKGYSFLNRDLAHYVREIKPKNVKLLEI